MMIPPAALGKLVLPVASVPIRHTNSWLVLVPLLKKPTPYEALPLIRLSSPVESVPIMLLLAPAKRRTPIPLGRGSVPAALVPILLPTILFEDVLVLARSTPG